MSFHVPANQSVCWTVYQQSIIEQMSREGYKLPYEFYRTNQRHIMRAFDHGEPIWSIVLELQLYADNPPPKREKTPLELAVRVVRF